MELFKLIDEYKHLLDMKDAYSEDLKQINKDIEAKRNELSQMMIDEECPKVSRNGFLYSLQHKTKYNKKACDEDEFFQLLEDNGLSSIIKRTVNAQTLNGTMAELSEENGGELPAEFEDFVSKYEFYDIVKRKETNKAAKK